MERLPLKVNWRLTYDCDNWTRKNGYGCVFCYSPEKKARGKLADYRQLLQLIRDRGARIVVLTGGEPLRHPQIHEIIQFLRNHEILINLSTNGLHLKEKLPSFYDDVAVISLPLDGPSAHIHDGMRNWDGHFDQVIALLNGLRERSKGGARIPKIKIETVLGRTNSSRENMSSMAKLLKEYPICVWKLFEYNYYPDRTASSRWYQRGEDTKFNTEEFASITNAHVSFARCCCKEERTECYFMLNPNGTVILPTLKNKNGQAHFEDEPLGDFIGEPDETIRRWGKRVDQERFASSLDAVYRDTYELLESEDSTFDLPFVLRDPLQKALWRQIQKCALAMIYENTDDFAECRIIDGRTRKDLLDYLGVAKQEVCIIAHLLQETVNDIHDFFGQKIAKKARFAMTVILPSPDSGLVEYMSRSRCKRLDEDYKISLRKTVERLRDLSEKIHEKSGDDACSLGVYTLDTLIPYASVVMIDRERIQIETKFPTLDENRNVILEFVKSEGPRGDSSYFEYLKKSIEGIMTNHVSLVRRYSSPDHLRKTKRGIGDTPMKSRAFIVHGHDAASKLELKNLLQNRLGFDEPLILSELPSQGRTIIEKFEEHAKRADIAFALLTPDDYATEGASGRARQNAIFELGYFLGVFGRKTGRVIVLLKGDVEIPSDLQGIVRIDITHGVESAAEQIRREIEALRESEG